MESLKNREWRRLIRSIRDGKCILVLGPRAAIDPRDENAEPLCSQLARQQADDQDNITNPENLAQVAQQYRSARDRSDLELDIEDFFKPYNDTTTELHRNLAALPFPLYINLFFDRFMLNALRDHDDKETAFDYYHFRETRSAGREPSVQKPLVFNLFGEPDDPKSLVLSENDLLDFLVNVVKRTPPLQSNITSLLYPNENEKYAFLFLGLGFQQWHVRILLHALQMLGHQQPSLAIEDDSFFQDEHKSTAVFFEQHHEITFHQESVSSFVAELRRRFEQEAGAKKEEEIIIPENAPTVFLCHRSTNQAEVAELEKKLHNHGIDTWRDRQNLRGGDNWNQVIQHILNKRCDYVLILQTWDMVNAVRVYCKREIEIALDIQKEFGEFKFVIPVRLDDCESFASLNHLNVDDLYTDTDLERLVQTILQDWRLRQEKQQRLRSSTV